MTDQEKIEQLEKRVKKLEAYVALDISRQEHIEFFTLLDACDAIRQEVLRKLAPGSKHYLKAIEKLEVFK